MQNKQPQIDILELGQIEVNCYLVSDSGQAILIDPGDEPEKIVELIQNRKVTITKIVITHGHNDHIGAVAKLKEFTHAPVLIHKNDAKMLTDAQANLSAYFGVPVVAEPADGYLNDGDIIEMGAFKFKVIHTPGHTPGGILLWEPNSKIVFTGDTLFADSIGRTDLPGSDHDAMMHSLRQKVMSLPDDTIVYPGHGPATTIGEERKSNPWLN
jgi:hydroxyacylglutathione hydrolase